MSCLVRAILCNVYMTGLTSCADFSVIIMLSWTFYKRAPPYRPILPPYRGQDGHTCTGLQDVCMYDCLYSYYYYTTCDMI